MTSRRPPGERVRISPYDTDQRVGSGDLVYTRVEGGDLGSAYLVLDARESVSRPGRWVLEAVTLTLEEFERRGREGATRHRLVWYARNRVHPRRPRR